MYCDTMRCGPLTKDHAVSINYRTFQMTRAELGGHSEFSMSSDRASEWHRVWGQQCTIGRLFCEFLRPHPWRKQRKSGSPTALAGARYLSRSKIHFENLRARNAYQTNRVLILTDDYHRDYCPSS